MRHKLSFTSFTSVRLQSGHFILFPDWYDTASSTNLDKKPIDRVSIQRSDEANGAVLGSSLDVALSEAEFDSLRQSLRRADLQKEPIVLAVETTDGNEVVQLEIAGKNVFGPD